MNWADVLSAQTGYSPDVFEDVLYIQDGTIIHVLLNIIDRATALKTYPKQEMSHWPRATATHRFKCMCGRLVAVEKGVVDVSGLQLLGGGPCRYCLYKLPEFMCDKAVLEMVGGEETGWIHADSLRIGRARWRP